MLKEKLIKSGLFVLVLASLIVAGYFYNQVRVLKQDPQLLAQKEGDKIIKTIGKLVILPTDEVPTVATVSDLEALKGQTFFEQAEEGDKVLIYTQAKKAILYSTNFKKIIDIAPLNIEDPNTTTSPSKP